VTVKVRLLKRKHNNIQTLVQVPDKDVNEKEDIVMSFSQQIENFHAHFTALMEETLDPLTTRQLKQNGYTWRAILTKDLNLFLQLASATFPVTVELW